MHWFWVPALLASLVMLGVGLRDAHVPSIAEQSSPARAYAGLPLAFVPNRGQAPHEARYYSQGGGYAFGFGRRRATFAFERGDQGHVLGLRFVGANPHPAIEARRRSPGRISHFDGSPRTARARSLPTYREIVYRNLWPRIDMAFTGTAAQLKYSFLVRPGGSVSDIRLAYEGARGMSLNGAGDLVVRTSIGSIRDPRPRSHQRVEGRNVAVTSAFAPAGSMYGVDVGRYDRRRALMIDPGLVYGTFLGGSDEEWLRALAVDEDGHAYVTGYTGRGDFPTTPGAYVAGAERRTAVFVTKLDPSGSELVYSALVGGSENFNTLGNGIAVDRGGNAYVTGNTNQPDFPTTEGAYDTTFNGAPSDPFDRDGFVFKLSADGSRLVYSTFLGTDRFDTGNDVAVDRGGNAYVTGQTFSPVFPTTSAAFDTSFDGFADAFVTKLTADGSGLAYSSYLGGNSGENHEGTVGNVEVDDEGAAYLTGTTLSSDFPVTAGVQDTSANGSYDTFVTKVTPSGSLIERSTLVGGVTLDYAIGLAIDPAGNAYVAGRTYSSDFPVTPGAFDTSYNGQGDGFGYKLAADTFRLVYSTYLGGTGPDNFESYGDAAVDRGGRLYITGGENSPDFPLTEDAFDAPATIGAFLTKLSSSGSEVLFSTLLAFANPTGVAVGGNGSAYVAGVTYNARVLTTPDAFDPTYNGGPAGGDGFVMRVDTSKDTDGDGDPDDEDNCPETPNADQHDADADGAGDECDPDPGNTECSVAARGRLAGNRGARLALDAQFQAGDTAPAGEVRYHDGRARLKLKSNAITSLIAYGRHATLRGTGETKNQSVTFRVDLDARSGADPAHVQVTLSNGYTADGRFIGRISIDCPPNPR